MISMKKYILMNSHTLEGLDDAKNSNLE